VSERCLTIVGGGLAGLSLGVALRGRGVPVRVLEAGSYPRHRVCGEFISGVTEAELAALGIDGLFTDARRHEDTMWCDSEGELLRARLPQAAIGLSRFALDQRLVDELRRLGGVVETGERMSMEERGDESLEGWVWATGRPRRSSDWVGLKGHYEDLELGADLELHVSENAYVGLAAVEDGRVNVCGLFRMGGLGGRTEKKRLLPDALERVSLRAVAERLLTASVDVNSVKGVNQFLLGWQVAAAADELRLGDRAAMIPPFTGNGMSMAFQGALDAVEPLERWSKDGWSWRQAVAEVKKRHRRRFARRLMLSWMLQGALMSGVTRTLAMGVVRKKWLPFERVYQWLR
jgi:flavin-dependent dehydrogenase